MTRKQMYLQAGTHWNCCAAVRRQYHTFDNYWRERYGRVYRFEYRFMGILLWVR